MEHHLLYTCEKEFIQQLTEELARVYSGAKIEAHEGFVECLLHGPISNLPIAFARQILVDPESVAGLSINQTVEAVHQLAMEKLASSAGRIRLHIFGPEQASGSVALGRGKIILESLQKYWAKKQRRFLRALSLDNDEPWQNDDALIQVALLSPEQSWIAVTTAAERLSYGPTLSRYPSGLVLCPQDKRPPARAYQKLLEAQRHLGLYIKPGECCVDLGAAPGSWTYVALAQGAQVTALDRAELRADLMASPRLNFMQADAFKFRPAAPVDWLLSDIIAYPERLIQLVEDWVSARACRNFIVTIKFKGPESYHLLESLKQFLAANTESYDLRHLHVNKNEVTAMGRLW